MNTAISENDNTEFLKDSRIMITGMTGLIGKTLARRLLAVSREKKLSLRLIAPVRNMTAAQELFRDDAERIRFIQGDITTVDLSGSTPDYIIHCASQTSSQAFLNEPVETIRVTTEGTRHMLEYARGIKNLKRFIYLSTMEVYGTPQTDDPIMETSPMYMDTMNARASYPVSKRLTETLCVAYMKEYGVPVNVLRLTQTFGPGVKYDDGRVFAEFARCAIEKRDIILKTKGETKRSYLYTEDAADAILTILRNGIPGEAYNVANPDTYCSIYEMANLIADRICGKQIKVQILEQDLSTTGYAPVLHMNLDTKKLEALGWKAKTGLEEMYRSMIDNMDTKG